jgi:hypothetical protein
MQRFLEEGNADAGSCVVRGAAGSSALLPASSRLQMEAAIAEHWQLREASVDEDCELYRALRRDGGWRDPGLIRTKFLYLLTPEGQCHHRYEKGMEANCTQLCILRKVSRAFSDLLCPCDGRLYAYVVPMHDCAPNRDVPEDASVPNDCAESRLSAPFYNITTLSGTCVVRLWALEDWKSRCTRIVRLPLSSGLVRKKSSEGCRLLWIGLAAFWLHPSGNYDPKQRAYVLSLAQCAWHATSGTRGSVSRKEAADMGTCLVKRLFAERTYERRHSRELLDPSVVAGYPSHAKASFRGHCTELRFVNKRRRNLQPWVAGSQLGLRYAPCGQGIAFLNIERPIRVAQLLCCLMCHAPIIGGRIENLIDATSPWLRPRGIVRDDAPRTWEWFLAFVQGEHAFYARILPYRVEDHRLRALMPPFDATATNDFPLSLLSSPNTVKSALATWLRSNLPSPP